LFDSKPALYEIFYSKALPFGGAFTFFIGLIFAVQKDFKQIK
jgi:hypothetical protein